MNDSEFSDFTKLVLARLETNPDEFQMNGRWDTLVRALEAHATGDTDNRYAKVLWPLNDDEHRAIFEAYRKAYLARLHKDMLKNIVSGDDLSPKTMDPRTYQYANSNDINPLKGGVLRGNSPSTVLTTSAMQNQTLATLNSAFDTVYAKAEGQPVQMENTNTAYKYVAKDQREKLNKILVTHTDHVMAKKMGMTVQEYVKRRDAL